MQRNFKDNVKLEHLMCLVQQGDRPAYARVFEEITPVLRSFVGKKLSRSEDVEDVVQEILISMLDEGPRKPLPHPMKQTMFWLLGMGVSSALTAFCLSRPDGHQMPWLKLVPLGFILVWSVAAFSGSVADINVASLLHSRSRILKCLKAI